MNETSNVLRGILHPDGTLELAGRPTLPAGDVEVTIRPAAKAAEGPARPVRSGEAPNQPARRDPTAESLWEFMERTRAEIEASGHQFRTTEEIDADIEEMRDWGEDRLEAARTPTEGYSAYLARVRARRETDGYPFRSKAEIDADIDELRSWGEPPEAAAREDECREAQP